jgi:hypothetical protein
MRTKERISIVGLMAIVLYTALNLAALRSGTEVGEIASIVMTAFLPLLLWDLGNNGERGCHN